LPPRSHAVDYVNMKKTTNLLLGGILAALFCSTSDAQLIYSNNFSLGAAVNISNMPPTVANTFAGGTNTATWNDAIGTNNTGGLLADGTDTTTIGDSFLLPFTPQSGHIYVVTANLTFTNNPGSWVGIGFSQNDPTNIASGNGRFADSGVNGYDFAILTESSGNVQYFAGPHATATIYSANGVFPPGPGTNTLSVILNTENPQWSVAAYVNGIQAGTNYTYSANPTLRGVGLTHTTLTLPTAVQWNYFTLSAALTPFIIKQPTSQTVSVGASYSNVVSVAADPSGGTLYYQWFTNGVPLVNGGAINGVTTSNLTINPVSGNNAGSNYYVVVSNSYGVATSSVASLTVFVLPVLTAAYPIPYTNTMTLFGGTNVGGTNYVGSTPSFSVVVGGTQPLTYKWLTNGVVAAGATNASFTLTNCPLNGPTNFACIVTNSHGAVSNTWSALYVPTPVTPYPQSVLAAQPAAFWRLNEPDNNLNNGNPGVICNDYDSGNNGIYTNVYLSQTGYNSADTNTSAVFAQGGVTSSVVEQIQGVDFAVSNGANAEFTVEAWASCASGGGSTGGAPVITKGTFGVNDAFSLGVDTNSTTQNYQFYVRSANGTVYTADSSIPAVDFTWHHLVGVCDEANNTVSLYVDGHLAASAYIPANAGNYEVASPVSIGAGMKSGATTYNLQFTGYIADVSVYRYALGSQTVAAQYIGEHGPLGPQFAITPPTSVTVDAGGTLVIPASLIGSAPLGFYWTDANAGTNVAAGATNGEVLNATLTFTNVPANWNGDQMVLTVTNSQGTANASVTLNVISGPPQILTNVVTTFGAPLGGTGSNSIVVAGSQPLYFQWQFMGTNLTDNGQIIGSQSNILTIADAQLADQGDYQVIISNSYNAVTSSVAEFVVLNSQPVTFNGNGVGWTVDNVVNISSPAFTNGLLVLTDGGMSEARDVFFTYPVYIGAFQASFTFEDVGGGGADGWAFILQNDPRGVGAVGGDAGRVGVGSGGGSSASITPSWEAEFNIYGPQGIGYVIDTGGVTGGPYLPTGDPNDTNYTAETNMLSSGDPINMTFTYSDGVMTMTMTDTNTSASFTTNLYIGDLTQIVEGQTAYVGFGAGDGGVASTQVITNFEFVSFTSLAVKLNRPNALISWSGTIIGYELQENSDLTTTNWVNVTNQVYLTNGLNQVTVPLTSSNQFYRLILQP
jgi:hypothetical protein